jgi:nucleoside-diphosphate-sugar epimerase
VKVLVTGGNGYLGGAIVRALARHGHEPVIFARHATASAGPACARIDGDVLDRTAVMAAVRGVDAVCHVAALVSAWRRDRSDFDRVNVGGLETVVDVVAALGTPRLIYTSSFLALPPAGRTRALEANDYQRSKVRAHEVARSAIRKSVPVVTLVPGIVYGPGAATEGNLVDRLIRDYLAGTLPGIVGADRVWSFSFIDDVAEAHVAALEQGEPGTEYMVGGENLPQIRLFELIAARTGRSLPRRIPGYAATALAWMAEVSAGKGKAPRITRGTVKILQHDWPVDSARSVQKLSYRITPLSVGIQGAFDGAS